MSDTTEGSRNRARACTKRAFAIALLAVVIAGAVHAAPEPVRLRLIGINDFHGNLEAGTLALSLTDPAATGPDAKPLRVPAGGAAAIAGLVKTLRTGSPHSLMLSAGDLVGAAPLVSTLFRHESTIDVMNRIGLELNAVGNHEFDAGVTELQRLAQGGCAVPLGAAASCANGPYTGARFPFIASNVADANGKPVLAPYVVKHYAGVKVGIIGAVTRSTPGIVVPSGVAGLVFGDEAQAVNRTARQLSAMGVKTLVAVFHEGGETGTPEQRGDWNDTSCPNASGAIFRIARRLDPEIRVIFSAHTHQGYRCIVEGRTLIQGTSYGRGISVVDIGIDRQTGRLVPAMTRSYNLPVLNERVDPAVRERLAAATPAPFGQALADARPDEAIAERVATYVARAAPIAGRPIGSITGTFRRGGPADSAAGRLIADSQLAATRDPERGGAQVAFMNPGGIRSDLECNNATGCPVTFGQVFTMQPFGNTLVVMTLTGGMIRDLLESQQKRVTGEPTLLQPSEGLSYTWLANQPPGQRVADLKLDGQPLQPGSPYRVTVNSFLAEGGDGFVILKEGKSRVGGMLDLDALVDYLQTASRSPVAAPRIARP